MKAADLRPHPDNPNIGDVDAIKESIVENGVFRPVVFNRRNGYMAAGHHQKLAMVALGIEDIPVVVIDVNENRHKKIMLADNETTRKATYDVTKLDRVLKDLGNITGTGFTELDAVDIGAKAAQIATTALTQANLTLDTMAEDQDRQAASKSFARSPLGEEPDPEDATDVSKDEGDEVAGPSLESANEELTGAFTLKDDMAFDGIGVWGLPRMRSDMLMTYDELPKNLRAWAGSATKDWPDPEQWWLYNWGIDSTSGMRDVSKVVISFFCFDDYFENWWYHAKKYVTKCLNSGIKYAVMPDFSMHTPGEESRVLSLWALYRSRWLARYFQECGLKVIPNVTWATKDMEFLTKHTLPTLPKNIPLLAVQVQTLDDTSKGDVDALQLILDTVKPEALLIYHGKRGERIFREGKVKFRGDTCFVESRMAALSAQASKREKKKTI